ncbi:MAG: hypothetical protein NZ928_01575 [Endomicrobia bacterium]|nr:hypothetical protein [Endomicrobiia bacterium]MDW8056363.1 hypothetical protein [Elusimicrobiota bacterium]
MNLYNRIGLEVILLTTKQYGKYEKSSYIILEQDGKRQNYEIEITENNTLFIQNIKNEMQPLMIEIENLDILFSNKNLFSQHYNKIYKFLLKKN